MLAATTVVTLACLNAALGGAATIPFDDVRLYVEHNATDGDAEVVIIVNNDVPFKTLYVYDPNGRRVVNFKAGDSERIGVREFLAESAEPSMAEVFEAYPEGRYRITGRTIDDDTLRTFIDLSHDLPPAPVITEPLADAVDVPVNGSVARWQPVPGAQGYIIELEQEFEDSEESITSSRPAGTHLFRFPNNWLQPGAETQLGVHVIGPNGNITVTEITFTTAP